LGLAGQSGSGKSTIALAIMRLLHLKGGAVRGQIRFRGCDLLRSSEREMRAIRGREISLVLQESRLLPEPRPAHRRAIVGGLGSP
jgi:ABC-type glutathione transport system ATPase component